MSGGSTSNRRWLSRVRELRARDVRLRNHVCYVEGIRQVLTALEAGLAAEAVFVDAARLRSDIAHGALADHMAQIESLVTLKTDEFERISTRDNPVGIAAIVRWAPIDISDLREGADALYLIADDVRDPGNLGTLIRAADAAGAAAVIVRGGTDPGHPNALRAALGTTFQLPIATAESTERVLHWAGERGITTAATSARGEVSVWEIEPTFPAAVFVGNEGTGLPEDVVQRCDLSVRIPMFGTATSLNVSVAAGILLYEFARHQRRK